jgi:hypothetical protein
VPAKITIIVTCGVAVGLTLVLRGYYVRENRRRERMGVVGMADREFLDLTDRENEAFRYKL